MSSRAFTGWALADFDGDDDFDLATASSARHDARGYAQEVLVSFGARHSSFKFRSQSATVDLSSIDIDGDLDHDLVVREPLSMKPIGVWLNDGDGFFHEGNLADFPELAGQRAPATWHAQRQRISLVAVFDERIPLTIPQSSAIRLRSAASRVLARTDPAPQIICDSAIGNRGPPRNA